MSTLTRSRRVAVGAVISLTLLAAACGDKKQDAASTPTGKTSTATTHDTSTSASSAPASSEPASSAPASDSASSSAPAGGDLAAKVPDAIKADGKIVVGTDSTYAPSEFLDADGKTVVGFDVDLFNAVAAKLGLKAEYVSASFDAIIPGVGSGKYEIGVSSFTINDKRKQAANMVSYFQAGTQWAVKTDNPKGVAPDNACGKNVAVQKDTVQVDDLNARSKKCTADGKKAITIDQYPGQDTATAAVISGKDDAVLADSPVVAYAVSKTSGKLALIGDIYDSAPYGYVIKQDQKDFADAIAGALKAVIADGSYKTALAKWGVEAGAITDPAVNP